MAVKIVTFAKLLFKKNAMSKYLRVLAYLKNFKLDIFLYFLFNLISMVFSVVSIGMLMPFLQLIFSSPNPACAGCNGLISNSNNFLKPLNTYLAGVISQGPNGKQTALFIICGFMLSAILLKNIFFYLAVYVLNPIKSKVVAQLRKDVFAKILRLPIGYLTESKKGDIMSRLQNDVNEIEVSVIGTVEGFIRDPINIIVTLVSLLLINAQLTLIILTVIPIMGFIIGRISKSLRQVSKKVFEKYGQSMSTLEEALGGIRIIKAFNAETAQQKRYNTEVDDTVALKVSIDRRRDLSSPLSEVFGVLIFCGILCYGGIKVLNQNINLDGAMFMTFLGLFYLIIAPAKTLATSFSNMRKGGAAIDRVNDILNAPETINHNPNGKLFTQFNTAINFTNVGFAYGTKPVLQNINLNLQKGSTTALVGSSGAGKSTLADLIPRFHDVTSGTLTIDGVNIKDYQLHSLRNLIGIVTQEPILFNDTIANNIALGVPNATEAEIIAAAKIANAHQFIINKANGYQTNVGDRGSKLSGGERQRITIARAVLKNPPILILDEATSSLDAESEKLVQEAINNLMSNRTSIVIAHRLSTIKNATEIIVLQHGQIIQRGTHNTLVQQQGLYQKLVAMQDVQ
jgi:ATP-binding cassette, subfamily B, bacterial MsbA